MNIISARHGFDKKYLFLTVPITLDRNEKDLVI